MTYFVNNFKTGEGEIFPDVLTNQKAKEFIPQEQVFQMLYECYRLKGMSPLDSMIKVLGLATEKKEVEDV